MEQSTPNHNVSASGPASLAELAAAFLRLGLTAFGGPAAHIAMMRQEFVERKGWLSEAEYLDLIGAASVIPGPSSTEVAMYVGHRCSGLRGLFVAGICFILPAAVAVTFLALAYHQYGRLPVTRNLFYGVEPVIVAIVAQALYSLGRTAIKTYSLAFVSAASLVFAVLGAPPVLLLFSVGLLYSLAKWGWDREHRMAAQLIKLGASIALLLAVPAAITTVEPARTAPPKLWSIVLVFMKIGAVVYGSGYVLLVFLRSELVMRLHWITPENLINAVAVGQLTPGPVFTTATFIGYLTSGPAGAAVATLGIFLPAFIFTGLSGPILPLVRKLPTFRSFLDAVNAASLALMAFVTIEIGRVAIKDPLTAVIAVCTLLVLLRWRMNTAWLVMAGAVIGLAAHLMR